MKVKSYNNSNHISKKLFGSYLCFVFFFFRFLEAIRYKMYHSDNKRISSPNTFKANPNFRYAKMLKKYIVKNVGKCHFSAGGYLITGLNRIDQTSEY